MQVALVGPTHPLKGGVAAHTTALAHRLRAAGHDVTLVSWSRLYPGALYPGEASVPDGSPDAPPFEPTDASLSWARPDSWVRAGLALRRFDAVVVVHVVPAVAPAHVALLRAARGRGRAGGPRLVVLAHNVLPHEPHVGARALVQSLLCSADAVLVHTADQAQEARDLGAREVAVAAMAPHLPGGPPLPRPAYEGPTRLLALGMVRDYKGVDLAVRAVLQQPERPDRPTITVAGELWGAAGRTVQALAADPRARGRVRVLPGYVPGDRLAALLAEHDVLTLTYRSATASQNAVLAHAHGLPVLASDVGTFGADVRDGVDGLLVPPGDQDAVTAAVARLADRGLVDTLRAGVRAPDLDAAWIPYLQALEALMTAPTAPHSDGQTAAPPGGAALAVAKRVAERALWTRVGVQRRLEEALPVLAPPRPAGPPSLRRLLPRGVPATGVLQSRQEWQQAVAEARELRLPLHRDLPKNWDALGAVGAVLSLTGVGVAGSGGSRDRDLDEGRDGLDVGGLDAPGGPDWPGRPVSARDLRVMDAGSARYSPVLPWLRLYGLGDLPGSLLGINLEFGEPVSRDGVTFRYGDATDTGLPAGSLDAVTCMSVIEHGVPLQPFLAEAARVLRPGGVLCVSTDYDQDPPDTSGHTAYGGPVHIFSPAEVLLLVDMARRVGLDLVGELDVPALRHPERPVHWRRVGLDYTFVLLSFRRR